MKNNRKQVLKKRQRDLSILKFQENFATEAACHDYLFQLKWPNGFVCDKCGHTKYYIIAKRMLYQCANCKKQNSVTGGTLLQSSHVKLRQWFWAIYLVSRDKRGYSALALKNAINVSYPTAWLMMQKIRTAMATKDQDYILNGIVMVDDAFFGGKTEGKKRGRGTEKQKVLIAVSLTQTNRSRYAKMTVIENMESETITKVMDKTVSSDSCLLSDGHRTLKNLPGHDHQVVIVSRDKKQAQSIFKPVHQVISNAKANILSTYHGLSNKHRQKYLDEYCYRLNRRFCEPQIFGKLVKACVLARPITYAEITL